MYLDALIRSYVEVLPRVSDEARREEIRKEIERLRKVQAERKAA